jgi:hypothetical protein
VGEQEKGRRCRKGRSARAAQLGGVAAGAQQRPDGSLRPHMASQNSLQSSVPAAALQQPPSSSSSSSQQQQPPQQRPSSSSLQSSLPPAAPPRKQQQQPPKQQQRTTQASFFSLSPWLISSMVRALMAAPFLVSCGR